MEHDKALHEMEQTHSAAAEHLERMFDKRLELERQKQRVLQASKDDQQFQADEAVARLRKEHQGASRLQNARHLF